MIFKTWRVACLVGCIWGLFLLACPAPAVGQENGSAGGSPAAGGNIQDYLSNADQGRGQGGEYITFDVKDKDLNEVLRFIGRRVGVNIVADPEVREKVTIQLDRVDWRSALDVIARQTHCRIVEENDRLIRFVQPPSISMEFQDADIKVVLDLLAKQSGANIVMASDVQGKVSLSLREVPWREALQTVVETAGYVTVKADTTTGSDILRVVRPESLKNQLVTEYYALKYIRPDDPYVPIISDVEKYTISRYGSTASGSLEKSGGDGQESSSFTLEEALRDMLSKEGSLKYDPHTNTFIVKDTKPKLDEIREIVRRVDVEPALVFVEVKFISTANGDILERGLKFDDPGTPERDGIQVSFTAPPPDSTATDPLFLYGGTFPFDLGKIYRIPEDFSALGVLDFTQTHVMLSLVKDDSNSRIVQEPTLTMLDNKPATIFVGDEVPFAVQKVQQDQNGNSTVTIEENKRSPINVGFTLYLIPHVIPGTDMINLMVLPKVSTLSGTTSPIQGFERFSFGGPGTGTSAIIDLPRQSLQTVVTYLRVNDGHTAVIGGLQSEQKTEIETKIPFLSTIPVLGNLFQWRRKESHVESIIIMITPHIVKNAGDADLRFDAAMKKHQEKDYFYQKYEKPEAEEEAAKEKGEGAESQEPEAAGSDAAVRPAAGGGDFSE